MERRWQTDLLFMMAEGSSFTEPRSICSCFGCFMGGQGDMLGLSSFLFVWIRGVCYDSR